MRLFRPAAVQKRFDLRAYNTTKKAAMGRLGGGCFSSISAFLHFHS